MKFETLTKRKEFLWVAKGHRWATPGLILQGRERVLTDRRLAIEDDISQNQLRESGFVGGDRQNEASDTSPSGKPVVQKLPRFGFTATKKLGTAVVRNRVKRRLREVVRQVAEIEANSGFDYVLVGTKGTIDRPFKALQQDLQFAFLKIHTKPRSKKRNLDRVANQGTRSRKHPKSKKRE